MIITSRYVARPERESEDTNNLIRDLGEFVERVDALHDKLNEDARRIGELRERLEQGIAESTRCELRSKRTPRALTS